MRSFVSLLKREWLEGQTAYLAAPAVVLTLIVLAGLFASTVSPSVDINSDEHPPELLEGYDGEKLDGVSALVAWALDVAGSTDQEINDKITSLLTAVAGPFHITLMFVTFFALLSCIHDERKDRSVLFWKSMPVSDTHTVLGKYVTIAWIVPLATIAGIFLAQLFATTYISLYVEEGFAGTIWAAASPWATPFHLLLGYAVHGLWAAPVYAWVMLVSAWASRAPLLWAIGGPVVVILLERIVFDTSHLATFIGNHVRSQALPRLSGQPDMTFTDQLAVLADPGLWLGMIIGGGLLVATIYCRKRFNEI